jgi:hypothetical protein
MGGSVAQLDASLEDSGGDLVRHLDTAAVRFLESKKENPTHLRL